MVSLNERGSWVVLPSVELLTFIDEMSRHDERTRMSTVQIITTSFHTERGHALTNEYQRGFFQPNADRHEILEKCSVKGETEVDHRP